MDIILFHLLKVKIKKGVFTLRNLEDSIKQSDVKIILGDISSSGKLIGQIKNKTSIDNIIK